MPSPDLFFQTINSYQRSAALKTALELDVFTAIGDGPGNLSAIAQKCGASERGTRILCDYLTVLGFLTKSEGGYTLTPDSAAFLTTRSPAYLGGTVGFLTDPQLIRSFDGLADIVRRGTIPPAGDMVSEANPVWVQFAKAMAPMMVPAARVIADLVGGPTGAPQRVLDIAAGHGVFGITIAERNRRADIVAVDWPAVLQVAEGNAVKAGVRD